MRLQLDEAEHHLHTRLLEIARPADVGLLVKARLQFHNAVTDLPASAASARAFTIGLSFEVR